MKARRYTPRHTTQAWIDEVVAEYPDGEGCRDWPFWKVNGSGYGYVTRARKGVLVGHLMLELTGRKRPTLEHFQLHSCDRRICVAPWHLRWGTAKENRDDAVRRGRAYTKITAAEARAIFTSLLPQQEAATQFGVSQRLVSMIRRGEVWRHATVDLGPPRFGAPPKTHCPRSHPYTPENTYTYPSGARMCRTCRSASRRRVE